MKNTPAPMSLSREEARVLVDALIAREKQSLDAGNGRYAMKLADLRLRLDSEILSDTSNLLFGDAR